MGLLIGGRSFAKKFLSVIAVVAVVVVPLLRGLGRGGQRTCFGVRGLAGDVGPVDLKRLEGCSGAKVRGRLPIFMNRI